METTIWGYIGFGVFGFAVFGLGVKGLGFAVFRVWGCGGLPCHAKSSCCGYLGCLGFRV